DDQRARGTSFLAQRRRIAAQALANRDQLVQMSVVMGLLPAEKALDLRREGLPADASTEAMQGFAFRAIEALRKGIAQKPLGQLLVTDALQQAQHPTGAGCGVLVERIVALPVVDDRFGDTTAQGEVCWLLAGRGQFLEGRNGRRGPLGG